ncbi:putative RNA-directed DNA polymerase from transposon X-element [Trichonephila clavipes]|nr:putative RNA-directed DNA polymerase from transposon X-element [Trichonephila clavipes]
MKQVYPRVKKEAIVLSILKPGKDPKHPLSYRPIALMSCLCKTMEQKSGFRKGRCTLDSIISLESKIRNAFVGRHHLVSIFFDIQKAYDRTWRYGILSTLYGYGLRGNLHCFKQNCLAAQKFKVCLGDTLSPSFIQAEGVPQGSILSVTIFICQISPILSQFQPSIQTSLHVDDLQINCEGSDIRLIERQLQTAVNKLVKCSRSVIFWRDMRQPTHIPSTYFISAEEVRKVPQPPKESIKHLLGCGSDISAPSISICCTFPD